MLCTGSARALARAPRLAGAALLLPMLAGCFQYSDVVTLRADGGGTFTLDLAVDRSALQSAAGLSGAVGSGVPGAAAQTSEALALPSRQEIEAALAKGAPGVKLTDYRDTSTPQQSGVHAQATFGTLAELTQLQKVLADEQALGGDAQVRFAYDKGDAGASTFRRSMGSEQSAQAMAMLPMLLGASQDAAKDSSGSAGADDAVADAARIQQALGQLVPGVGQVHMRFEVRLPGAVGQSNATQVDGNVAVWDYDFAHLWAAASSGTLEMRAVVKP